MAQAHEVLPRWFRRERRPNPTEHPETRAAPVGHKGLKILTGKFLLFMPMLLSNPTVPP